MNSNSEITVPLEQGLPNVSSIRPAEIRVHGKTTMVPAIRVGGVTLIRKGRWLKYATVRDEDLVEPELLNSPDALIKALKQSGLKADLFTFAQKVPESTPKFEYYHEWDNMAVVPVTTFKDWLEKRVEYDVRKGIRKATKLGVVARTVEYSDALVQGIVNIYNESTTRQGKAFWHYGKDFDTVKHESGTYLEKSEFIGAYFQEELVGFIKMAYLGKIASTIHVIGMKKHFDKKVTTLLLAKAVEICEQKGLTHLTYGNYIYSDPASSLTEFKRRNGFEKALLPRYYIPLTAKGKMALRLGLHRGVGGMIPTHIKHSLREARSAFYKKVAKLGEKRAASAGERSEPENAKE